MTRSIEMRRAPATTAGAALALVLALLACKQDEEAAPESTASATTAGSAAGSSGETRFSVKPPKKGTKVTTSGQQKLNFTVSASRAGKVLLELDIDNSERSKQVVEVLEANDKAPTKVKVTYQEKTAVEKQGSREKSNKSPVEGKSYIVEKSGADVDVDHASGGAAPKKERDVVREDFDDLGQTPSFAAFLPDRPLKKGEKLDVSKEQLRKMFQQDDDDKMKFDNATFQFVGTKQQGGAEVGVFEVKLEMVNEDETMRMKIALDGKLLLRVDGAWPVEMSLSGPISFEGVKKGIDVDGKGRATFERTAEYQ